MYFLKHGYYLHLMKKLLLLSLRSLGVHIWPKGNNEWRIRYNYELYTLYRGMDFEKSWSCCLNGPALTCKRNS
jgi:hypothetical protein